MKKKSNKQLSGNQESTNTRNDKRSKKANSQKNKGSAREKGLKKAVLTFLSIHKQQAFTSKQIISNTGLWRSMNVNKMRAFLDRLCKEGKVEYLNKGQYRYLNAKHAKIITGQIEVTMNGLGFLLQEDTDDILIAPSDIGKSFSGDTVKVKILSRRRKNGRVEGKVLEVVHRARTEFVGTIEEALPGRFFFTADDPSIRTDFRIPSKHLKKAKEGEKVLVRLLNWERYTPEAEVISILGKAGTHNTEMHAILLQYGFQPEFPYTIAQEAEKISEKISKKEISKRRDMRNLPTLTIDPVDAKDFDDALSIQKLPNGHYEVGIHIADVSHYVATNSLIDKEAFKRATSVYLVDRTVPMLPEKLSNKLCSLRPNEDKLTFSAVFELDEEAKIHKEWFGRTVIHSDYRFDYAEAQQVIDGKKKHQLKEALDLLQKIALALRSKRMGKGSIQFETEEVRFELDKDGKPLRVVKKERLDAHKLIEDFMLLANRRVATFVHGIFKDPPLAFVYRIHDHPDPEKLANLGKLAAHFGHKLNFEQRGNTSGQLNQLLKKVIGKPEQNVIESVAIRSMAKAVYSSKNIGHFGLGFPFYSHFTSPIRRYPDLMVHRLLDQYLRKEYKVNPTVLEESCKHCSKMERTAAEAERASIKYKQVEFLESKIGQTFSGIISGVIEAGFFVELAENLCEGFVPVRTMDDDYYSYHAEGYCLIGKASGEVLRLGDPVLVEVADTNLQKRQIEFAFIKKGKFKKKQSHRS